MKCLSYNIQAGIGTKNYLDYVFSAHRQLVGSPKKRRTIENIANAIQHYDVILLQEVDMGGRRNKFECQARQIQQISGHAYMVSQVNRIISRLSIHGNIILSKTPLEVVFDKKLPSKNDSKPSGRGILGARTTVNGVTYLLANTHFSLGKTDQALQFDYVARLLKDYQNVILAGDFNCEHDNENFQSFIKHSHLKSVTTTSHVGFPSWRPRKALDHIFVSDDIPEVSCQVVYQKHSDHLPLEMEVIF